VTSGKNHTTVNEKLHVQLLGKDVEEGNRDLIHDIIQASFGKD